VNPAAAIERRIRAALAVFVAGLVLSGLTAFPLETETRLLHLLVSDPALGLASRWPALPAWTGAVRDAVAETNLRHPFLAYGTDWLAFAHLVIAVAFVGPFRHPVRNVWVVEFGLIACAAVVPFALIAGPVRGIPLLWRLVDASFGVFGALPLLAAYRDIRMLRRRRRPCSVRALSARRRTA
jgi:hypothetical protein